MVSSPRLFRCFPLSSFNSFSVPPFVWFSLVSSPPLIRHGFLPSLNSASRFRDEIRSKNSPKKLATSEGNSQLGSKCPNSKAPENSFDPVCSFQVRAVLRFQEKREHLKRFEDFRLKAESRIWPKLSYMCHARSTVKSHTQHPTLQTLHPKPGAGRLLFFFITLKPRVEW